MNEMKEAVGNWREAKQFSPADENDFLRWLDKAEEHFLGVLAFRKKTVKGFSRNAAQGKIAPCLPVLRIKADER